MEDFHDKARETVCDYIEFYDYDVAPFLKRDKGREFEKVKYERIVCVGYGNGNHGNSQNVCEGCLYMV